MADILISAVTRADIPLFETGLRHLASDLGDAYCAAQDRLAEALCGPAAPCIGLIATCGGALRGALLATQMFSTLRGGAGLYVSDLWVAQQARGQGLSRRLLAHALRAGEARDAGQFLKLAVYTDNPRARAVYDRLGFTAQSTETNMALTGSALDKLRETP